MKIITFLKTYKKLNIDVHVVFLIACFITLIILNEFSWIFFFDLDGKLSPFDRLIFIIIDLVLIIFGIIFYLKVDFRVIAVNLFLMIILSATIDLRFGNWFFKDNLNHLNIIKDNTLIYDLNNLYNWDQEKIIYKRDQFGFRGTYKSINEIDIITIGGSTTDQRYISEGYTFQDILVKKFKENGRDISVLNAGIDGQSTYGHIKNFDWWLNRIPDLESRYIMVYLGVNDVFREKEGIWDELINAKKEINGEKSFSEKFSEKSIYSYLYRTLKGVMNTAALEGNHKRLEYPNIDDLTADRKIVDLKPYTNQIAHEYEKRLYILSKKILDFGSIPIFVTQSHRRVYTFIDDELYGIKGFAEYRKKKINGTDYYHMICLLHDRTKKVADKTGGIFLDLNKELDFDLEKDFYDHAHNTVSGSKKIGLYLYQKLKDII